MPGATELIVVLLILLLLFGATRLPGLGRSMGAASKEFKQGLKEGAPEHTVEGPCPFCDAKLDADTKFCPSCGKSAEEIVAKKRETASTNP